VCYALGMKRFRRVAVYCASSSDIDPAYVEAAREFGTLLVERGYGLVFGGGRVGLMGVVADAVTTGSRAPADPSSRATPASDSDSGAPVRPRL